MQSEAIKQRLTKRFASPLPDFYQRRIIFWRDEDHEFSETVDSLEFPGVKILKLTGVNNFSVKKQLAAADLENHYLVYDPLPYDEDHHDDWLLDVREYSEEFRADLVSLQMEELRIEPTSAMRKTVRLYGKFLENKERKEKLRRLGRSYQTPLQLHVDIMAVLCGISVDRQLSDISAQDIMVTVLAAGLEKENNGSLLSIERFGQIDAFWQLVHRLTGYVNTEERPLIDFASHILLTALSQTMQSSALLGLERFISSSNTAYCYQLIHEWQRNDKKGDLVNICRQVERELRLVSRFEKMSLKQLLKSDVFPAINETLLKLFLTDISEHVIKVEEISEAVENRRNSAWYDLTKDYFEGLYYIGRMQEFYLRNIQGFPIVEPTKIWKLYTEDAFEMDTLYRHFHVHYGKTLKWPNMLLEDKMKLASSIVEGLYHEWFLKQINQTWTLAIADDMASMGYVSGIDEQRRFFRRYVAPNAEKGNRTYVVVSDALRYEVAAELTEKLGHETKGQAKLESMQAIFPTITKFGMAALLPGKEITVNEKIEVMVDGQAAAGTSQREAILKAAHPNSLATTYKTLSPMSQKERRALVAGQEVVYIYHNVIDAVGDDRETEEKIFEGCQSAIEELISLVRLIVNDLSGANIIITADHGFLYTYRPLEESQKISSQTFSGNILELSRRYALASPGTTADYLLPVGIGHVVGGIPLEGFAPLDTIRIKRPGGGEKYVHGGISLQEMVVPVVVYKRMRPGYKKYVEVQNPGLSLISESRKLSNLMFSLDFLQNKPVDDKVQPSQYSLYFIDDSNAPVSDIQTVIADKEDQNASSRVFRLRFTLKPMKYSRTSVYRLRISHETDPPEDIDFHIDIAFADDFGFDL